MMSSSSKPSGIPGQVDPFAKLQSALQAAEGRLAQIFEAFDHLESGLVLYGPDDRLVFCNRRFREIYTEVADLLVPGVAYVEIARAFYRRGFESRTQQDEEKYVATRVAKHLDPDEGDYEWLLGEDTWLLVSDRKTADGGVIGFRLDITARKLAEDKLAQSEQRLTGLLEMSSDWYWEQDELYRFKHISGGMAKVTGINPEDRYGNSHTLGIVQPSRFIPIAEETGQIIGIGEWVIREACAQLKRWREAGLDPFPVTVNVSAMQFKTRRLIDVLLAATREHGLLPADIELELTETALVSQGDAAMSTLEELGKQGFHLVVDDFGTGYSNLAYLKRFDITKLKIDQSFVRDITTDSDDAAITRGIIGLAKSLGLRVVAEGVEHDAQLEYLVRYGCEEAQGYLLSKPLTPLQLQETY